MNDKVDDGGESRNVRPGRWLSPPRLLGEPTPAAMAHALAEWATHAAEMLEDEPCDGNRGMVEDRVIQAYRAIHWGSEARASDVPAFTRMMVKQAVIEAARWDEARALKHVRAALVMTGYPNVSLDDDVIRQALASVGNRGGRRRVDIKLDDALKAIWRVLGVQTSSPARVRDRRK